MPLYRVTQTATAYIFADDVESARENFEEVDPGNYVDTHTDTTFTVKKITTIKDAPKTEDDCVIFDAADILPGHVEFTVQAYFELKNSL